MPARSTGFRRFHVPSACPGPQHNPTRYHGVFAPCVALRSRIAPAGRGGSAGQRRRRKRRKGHAPTPTPTKANSPDQTSPDHIAPMTWATRRVTDHSSASSTSTSRNPMSFTPFQNIAESATPQQTPLEHHPRKPRIAHRPREAPTAARKSYRTLKQCQA